MFYILNRISYWHCAKNSASRITAKSCALFSFCRIWIKYIPYTHYIHTKYSCSLNAISSEINATWPEWYASVPPGQVIRNWLKRVKDRVYIIRPSTAYIDTGGATQPNTGPKTPRKPSNWLVCVCVLIFTNPVLIIIYLWRCRSRREVKH